MNRKIINKRLDEVRADVEKMKHMVDAIKTLDIERFKKQYENMLIDLVLLSEKVACKLRSLIYASGNVPKPEYLKRASYEHGIEISYEGAVLSIALPRLLPKRGGKYSSLFLMDPLHQALEEFTEEYDFQKFEECTVCIVHLYDASVLERPVFDFDNLQQKQLLDTIATHVMIDDAAPLCNVYCTTRRSKENLTRVYVMQKDLLRDWLQKTESDEI